ncbi:MAG: peptidylprolyl isomerase [Verrucomicrobia bacterium]|jgi:peptidylprolyl isomerase|nr:peptidylprolyl isomerase [Verrucomicrobiota bacterium]
MTDSKAPSVLLHTNRGDIRIRLFPEAAPKAVENFLGLAKSGYYDGVGFHRVIPEFMIQGGDPDGTGRGGQSIWGKPFADECPAEVTFDRSGLLAMANAGPNTNGSQFFITTEVTSWLDGKHTIFGEVTDGYDVVRKIENTPTGANDRPNEPQVIESIEIL